LQFVDPAAASALGHEFRVDVRVAVEDAVNVVRAPLGALFRRDAGWAVYKVVDGRARLTDVTVGIADGSYRQITAGLVAGDQVLLFPGVTVKDGQMVAPRKTK
jgi:HlyD family secretion protein